MMNLQITPNKFTILQISPKTFVTQMFHTEEREDYRKIVVYIAKNTNPSMQLEDITQALGYHILDDIIIESGLEEEISDDVLMAIYNGYCKKTLPYE